MSTKLLEMIVVTLHGTPESVKGKVSKVKEEGEVLEYYENVVINKAHYICKLK